MSPTMAIMAAHIARVFNLRLSDLKARRRVRDIADARLACYLILTEAGYRQSHVARFFGRHPSTVCTGSDRALWLTQADPYYAARVDQARSAAFRARSAAHSTLTKQMRNETTQMLIESARRFDVRDLIEMGAA